MFFLTYSNTSICTQTCNDGYTLDDGSRTSSLTCDTYNKWKTGEEFQMCRGSGGMYHSSTAARVFHTSIYVCVFT